MLSLEAEGHFDLYRLTHVIHYLPLFSVNSEDKIASEFYASPETPIELTEIASEDQIKDILLNDEGFASYLSHLDDSLSGSQGFEDGPNQVYSLIDFCRSS